MAAKVQGNEGQDPGAPQGSTGETRTMQPVRAQPPPPRPLMAGKSLQFRKVYIPPEGRIEDLRDAGILLTSEQLEVYSKIGPVLNHCSPDQVEHIFGLFAEVEADGKGPKVAAWWCRRRIGEFLIGPALDDCEDYQIGHILNYFADMITDGNKATFATQVCESMAILYRNDIESFLPIEYDVENDKM
ncbi:MAG: hypothetical protein LBF94_02875, partial [Puniceicoccales bacterium]|nr:hypothetical protein [Puniceicoccales bacterium]